MRKAEDGEEEVSEEDQKGGYETIRGKDISTSMLHLRFIHN